MPAHTAALRWHSATADDVPLLANWNHQLIRDEGHRNPMTVEQLADRMAAWLADDYRAVIFSTDRPVAYALYRAQPDQIYFRQFFVARDHRRVGLGRRAFNQLKTEVWPAGVRLTVDVLCANPAGIAFWRAVGYRDYCLTLEIMP
jgi:GNAT superfamily N-acetyltransferase